MDGASRRFRRSSSRQKNSRAASVVKSRNGKRTAFLILYATPASNSTYEMCVSTNGLFSAATRRRWFSMARLLPVIDVQQGQQPLDGGDLHLIARDERPFN